MLFAEPFFTPHGPICPPSPRAAAVRAPARDDGLTRSPWVASRAPFGSKESVRHGRSYVRDGGAVVRRLVGGYLRFRSSGSLRGCGDPRARPNARHDGTPPHHVRDGTALVACDARANAQAATRCGVFWGIGAVTLNVDTGLARRTEETQATLNLLTTLEHFVRSTRAPRLQSPRRESRPIGRPRREQRWSRTITAAYGFDVVVATPHCAISPTPALAGFGMDEGDPNQVPQRGWQRSHPHVEVTYS